MSGSLIANSSSISRSQDNGSNSLPNIYDSLIPSGTNTETTLPPSYDLFTSTETNGAAKKANKPETKDAQLEKILSNSELIRLYELKLRGQERDGNQRVDDLIKTAREKIGVNNGDINKYIGYKRTILESLQGTDASGEKVAKALNDINSLPEALKASLKASLKEKLNGKLQGSIYSAEQILDGDYANILKANPEITKSISNSLKALSTDDAFTTKLSSVEKEVKGQEQFNKNATKITTAGVATAAVGAGLVSFGVLNSWNPVGWGVLGAVGLTTLLTNDEFKAGLGNYWNALTG
ncbi:MAG: hypothetical protein VKK32_04410 [Candidatus Melainabacteria bacterium]|nr:hypothetical protein [Candidatus Melainabacteria bacterium]